MYGYLCMYLCSAVYGHLICSVCMQCMVIGVWHISRDDRIGLCQASHRQHHGQTHLGEIEENDGKFVKRRSFSCEIPAALTRLQIIFLFIVQLSVRSPKQSF